MAVVNEVVTKFTFVGSISKLRKFNQSLHTSITSLAKATTAVTALAGGFVFLISKIAGGNEKLIQLADVINVPIKKIQELGFAASQTGSDSAALEGTLSSLSKAIGDAAINGSDTFARLGITVRDSAGQVKKANVIFKEIGDRFKELKLSKAEKQTFASKLGIDPSLIRLLDTTNTKIAELTSRAGKLGAITSAQAKKMEEFSESMKVVKFAFGALKNQIAVSVAPELEDLAKKFVAFIGTNKKLISEGIVKLGKALVAVVIGLKRIGVAVLAVGKAFGLSKPAVIAFGVALAIALSPIRPITLAIGAVLLVIEDLIVAMHGGQSLIKSFWQNAFGVNITPILRFIRDEIFFIIKGIVKLFSLLGKLARFGKVAIKSVVKFVSGDEKNKSVGESARDKKLRAATSLSNLVLPSKPGGQRVSNNSVSQDVVINVNAPDAVAAGHAVNKALQGQLNDSQNQFKVGGL